MKKRHYLGIDIGGTKISAAIVTHNGKILSRLKIPTPLNASAEDLYLLLLKLISEILTAQKLETNAIKAIGLGVPGIVDQDNHILATPNIKLTGFPLCEKLKKKLKLKVRAGNDVNLGLLGEQWLGSGKKSKHIVGIFPGTGVGGAVIIDKKLWIGTHGAAAELGHMMMSLDGPRCGCGNTGCLEAFAGRWAIERDLRQGFKNYPKSILKKLIKDPQLPIKSKMIKTALDQHDPLTVKVMTQAALILGKACINVRHIFNPELIILGGGVMEACGDFLLPIIKQTFHSDPFFANIDRCKITTSKLGDDAVMLGAVALCRK